MMISSKLLQRTTSAVLIAPVFLLILYHGGWFFTILLLLAFLVSMWEWWELAQKTDYFVFCFMLGLVYISLSFSSFYALRYAYDVNAMWVFIGMIWFSDVGAYFTGKTIGGPKLIEVISPNKTWAGFFGALLFPALFAALWIYHFGFLDQFKSYGFFFALPLAFIIGIVMGSVGQAGDLMVSFVKRMAGVKDTGTLIPGHGGLLDRIDSMLLAAPIYFLLITLMSYVL